MAGQYMPTHALSQQGHDASTGVESGTHHGLGPHRRARGEGGAARAVRAGSARRVGAGAHSKRMKAASVVTTDEPIRRGSERAQAATRKTYVRSFSHGTAFESRAKSDEPPMHATMKVAKIRPGERTGTQRSRHVPVEVSGGSGAPCRNVAE
jgi:hypothetical protein